MAHNAFKITFIRTTIIILTGGLMIAKLLHTKSIPTAVYAFVIIVIYSSFSVLSKLESKI